MNADDYYDAADEAYADWRQEMVDAECEGFKVGSMGLGAGLCPQDYANDARNAWLKGFQRGARTLLNERKAA